MPINPSDAESQQPLLATQSRTPITDQRREEMRRKWGKL
jgi:hypothetical protein